MPCLLISILDYRWLVLRCNWPHVCKHHWCCSSLRLAARNSSTISFYVRSIDLLSPWNIAIDRPAIPEATNPIPCKLVRLLDTGPDSLLTMFSIWGKEGDIKTTETESFRLLRLPTRVWWCSHRTNASHGVPWGSPRHVQGHSTGACSVLDVSVKLESCFEIHMEIISRPTIIKDTKASESLLQPKKGRPSSASRSAIGFSRAFWQPASATTPLQVLTLNRLTLTASTPVPRFISWQTPRTCPENPRESYGKFMSIWALWHYGILWHSMESFAELGVIPRLAIAATTGFLACIKTSTFLSSRHFRLQEIIFTDL